MTLTLQQLVGQPGSSALATLLADLASGFEILAAVVERAALAGTLGAAGTTNAQGERQEKLDVFANELLVRACARGGHVATLASEELDAPLQLAPDGELLVALDPLDGSSNLGVNVSVGSIFSILRRGPTGAPEEVLQRGLEQLCAGYAIYGPATMLVVALAGDVHGFTLDRHRHAFVLTHPRLRIPPESREFAVNASNERFWEPPVRRYVSECLAGRAGPRGVDFNMRWVASLVAEVHRVLMRGGLFMYPQDGRPQGRAGRLRLLYEGSPMAHVVEQAGGAASTGRARLLEVAPAALHERVPVILGSRSEVERLVRYHREHDLNGEPLQEPLFNTRCLFSACESRRDEIAKEASCR